MALTAITAVVWLVLWAAVIPLVRGWSPVAVVSGSMAPLIDSGDIVVAAPYDGRALDAGAVIVFDNPTGTGSMTHRVVDVTPTGDYVTRGDANGHIDSTPVPPDTIQGVGRILVPAIATPFVWANNGQWTHLMIAAVAILAALWASRWALLARHNPWQHRPPPPVTDSITTIGALLGIWPTPQPAAVSQTTSAAPPTPTRARRGPKRLAIATTTIAFAVSAALVAPPMIQAQAAFTNAPDNTGNSWTGDTLAPPTGLTATGGATITLDWTATIDSYATGHRILRSTSPGGPYTQIAEITPRTTTTHVDSPAAGTYYYVARAYYLGWESVNSNEASATVAASAVLILDPWTTGTTHAVSAGTNRLLLVGVYGEDLGAVDSVNTVTWGGRTLTEINEVVVGLGSSNIAWLGYLDEAGIAAATGNTIVATWSGGSPPNNDVHYSAVTLENVDQTTPIGGSSTGTAVNAGTVQPAAGLSVDPDDLAVYITLSGSTPEIHTAASGYTEGTEESHGFTGVVSATATKPITATGTEQPNRRLGKPHQPARHHQHHRQPPVTARAWRSPMSTATATSTPSSPTKAATPTEHGPTLNSR